LVIFTLKIKPNKAGALKALGKIYFVSYVNKNYETSQITDSKHLFLWESNFLIVWILKLFENTR